MPREAARPAVRLWLSASAGLSTCRYSARVAHPCWSGKNKTFFFFNYGGYRTSQSESVDVTVPTAENAQWRFRGTVDRPVRASVLRRPSPDFRPVAAGGIANSHPWQPAGSVPGRRAYLPHRSQLRQPLPAAEPDRDRTARPFSATTAPPPTPPPRTNYYVTKITHNLTDRQTLNFSYTFRKLPSVKGGFPRFPEPFVAQGVWNQVFKSYYARSQHDWTLTPTLINHFNAGFSRSDVQNRNFTRGIPASSTRPEPERHAELRPPAHRVPRLRQPGDLDRPTRLPGRRIHLLRQPGRRQLGPPERLGDLHPRRPHAEVWR